MITIDIHSCELWDPYKNEFVAIEAETLRLEHSLVSLSKWESKWKKPFLSLEKKTREEILDYIRCMCLEPPKSPMSVNCLSQSEIEQIIAYTADQRTASTVKTQKRGNTGKNVTSELIYYWMVECGIPFEAETWHLSRLLMLIQICGAERGSQQKMSNKEIYASNHALNQARRKALHSKG